MLSGNLFFIWIIAKNMYKLNSYIDIIITIYHTTRFVKKIHKFFSRKKNGAACASIASKIITQLQTILQENVIEDFVLINN